MSEKQLIIGLTGGMGAGKTTVAKMFEELGIPVYYADNRAKELMEEEPDLVAAITDLFGEKAYEEGRLNNRYLAGIVFEDEKKLKELESLVHPVVREDFKKWAKKQKAPYIIVENAILHKSGMDKLVDLVIFVKTNDENKISRVRKRDGLPAEAIKQRLKNQNNDVFLLKKSDFVIENNSSIANLEKKIQEIDRNVKFMLKKR